MGSGATMPHIKKKHTNKKNKNTLEIFSYILDMGNSLHKSNHQHSQLYLSKYPLVKMLWQSLAKLTI